MKRHRRTLSLLVMTVVVGAMTFATPALAGSARPVGHRSRVRHCNAVTVISHGQQVRACLLRGARGPRGFKGITGPHGPTGNRGPIGQTGPQGPKGAQGVAGVAGTARAYAVVQPTSPAAANLILNETSHVISVSEPSAGIYCLVAAAGIDPGSDTAAVSPEVSYSSGHVPGVVALNALHTDCPTGNFEVETYAPGAEPKLASGYAFTIVIP